jgi:hypothetical protein
MLLLDSQAIVVTDRVKRRCVGRAALTAGDENQEVNQSDEMH